MQEFCNSNPPVITGSCNHKNTQARHHRNLKLESKLKYFSILILSYVIQVRQKNTLVSGNAADENKFHPGGRIFIHFSIYLLFYFSFFYFFLF